MKNYPYRFKTEKEFIKEFGENWRNNVKNGWITPDMNYLYGTEFKVSSPIDENFCEPLMDKYGHIWYISRDMLTVNKPNYSPKKIIKEI